jgi:hypothetical protein
LRAGGKAGKGNPYLNGVLGEIAASASPTDTFLGELPPAGQAPRQAQSRDCVAAPAQEHAVARAAHGPRDGRVIDGR